MKPLIFLALLVIIPQAVRGQVTPAPIPIIVEEKTIIDVGINDSPQTVAWKYLKETRSIKSRVDLKNKAIEALKEKGALPYERVEVDGVSTTDDTSAKFPGMFDKQLKLSYQNEPTPSSKVAQMGASISRFLKDLTSAASDMNRKQTAHDDAVLSEIRGHRINELIAHSWGTEAVYAGILSGAITPPKKLILVGIPEDDYGQWLLLAKYTGIEIHLLGFRTDKVQAAGGVVEKHFTGLPRDCVKLDQLWKHRCSERGDCADPNKFDAGKFNYNIDVNPPHEETMWRADLLHLHPHDLPSMDHDRMLYYQYLAKLGLFNKTVAQLDRFDFSQQKLIKEEENNTLSDAMTEAHAMIKVAREEFAKEAAAEVARRQEEQAKRQEEIQDAAAKERKRREDENSKQAARIAVRDMAVKACEHPDSVRQSELDALPHPVLPFYFPGDFDLPFCAQRLYSELGFAVQNGKKMDAEWLLDMVQRAQPPQAAYRPPVARAAPAPDFSEKYGDDVRDLAERACDGRETLPIDGLNALYELQRVGKVFNSAQVSQELSGCEKYVYDHLVNDIYVRYFRHTSSTVDELADLVFELSRKSRPPEPAQSLQPPTGSNRAPQPQRHCAAEKSGVCVYWTD